MARKKSYEYKKDKPDLTRLDIEFLLKYDLIHVIMNNHNKKFYKRYGG